VLDRVYLEMIVVAVEKGSGQFAGLPHFLHTKPVAEPIDIRIDQFLAIGQVHVMTP